MTLPLSFFIAYTIAAEDIPSLVASTVLRTANDDCGCDSYADDVAPQGKTPEKPVRWKGVLGVEGELTGDGRYIQPGALRWENLPIPLRYVASDVGAHQGAVVVGRIDKITRDEETGLIFGEGDFDMGSEVGREAARQVRENLMRGVSMDLDDVAFEVRIAADAPALMAQDPVKLVSEGEPDEDGRVKVQEMAPDDEVMVTTDARVRAATIVAVPAFSRAMLGMAEDVDEVMDLDGESESEEFTTIGTMKFRLAGRTLDVDVAEGTFNWVDDTGGLPGYIREIADALMKKGWKEGRAIATAVNVTKKMCSTGDLNFPGDQDVNPGSRAKACKAVAEWEEKKARAKADSADSTTFKRGNRVPKKIRPSSMKGTAMQTKTVRVGNFSITVPADTPVSFGNETFAYNPDQWRNPDNGRWIDMPGAALGGLIDLVQSIDVGEGQPLDDQPLVQARSAFYKNGGMDSEGGPIEGKADSESLNAARDAIDKTVDSAGNNPSVSKEDAQALKDAADEALDAIDAYENFYVPEEQSDITREEDSDIDAEPSETDMHPEGADVPDDVEETADEGDWRTPEYMSAVGKEADRFRKAAKKISDKDPDNRVLQEYLDFTYGQNGEVRGKRVDIVGLINDGRNIEKFFKSPRGRELSQAEKESIVQAVFPDGSYKTALMKNIQKGKLSSIVAAAPPIDTDLPPAAHFSNPNFKMPTPLTITNDGRVMGHLAIWGTCHLTHTNAGKCITPPKSRSGYAYFTTGAVLTKEGAEIPVGQITLGTGHAGEMLNAKQTLAHYDNTGTAVADIVVGEDAHGIWFSGSLRPGVTAAQVRTLRAHPLSGDWRRMAGSLELVASLCVNVQGFPVPRPKGRVANGSMQTLVAAGMLPPRKVRRPGTPGALSADDLRYLKRLAARERQNEHEEQMRTLAAADRLAKMLRTTEKERTLAAARRIRAQQMAARVLKA